MSNPKYPDAIVWIELHGPSGNAFAVLGLVKKALRRAGASSEECEQCMKDAKSSDYNNLLKVCGEWVTLIKLDEDNDEDNDEENYDEE